MMNFFVFSFSKHVSFICIIMFPDINECASGPCRNDGTCEDAVNGYACKCKTGFTGPLCETSRLFFHATNVKLKLLLFYFEYMCLGHRVLLP